jgi:hypothetical protein
MSGLVLVFCAVAAVAIAHRVYLDVYKQPSNGEPRKTSTRMTRAASVGVRWASTATEKRTSTFGEKPSVQPSSVAVAARGAADDQASGVVCSVCSVCTYITYAMYPVCVTCVTCVTSHAWPTTSRADRYANRHVAVV